MLMATSSNSHIENSKKS